MFESAPALLRKIAEYRPRFVCFIGKGMCANVEKIFKRKLEKMFAGTSNSNLQAFNRNRDLLKVKTEIGLRPFKLVYDVGSKSGACFE
jgi:hypothetical protein